MLLHALRAPTQYWLDAVACSQGTHSVMAMMYQHLCAGSMRWQCFSTARLPAPVQWLPKLVLCYTHTQAIVRWQHFSDQSLSDHSSPQHLSNGLPKLVLCIHAQVIMRWRRFSDQVSRQGAIVDRAVRMYNHRVIGGMQRAVLQASCDTCKQGNVKGVRPRLSLSSLRMRLTAFCSNGTKATPRQKCVNVAITDVVRCC